LPSVLKKVSNRCAQRTSDLKQFSSRHAVKAAFIFVNLRVGQADHFAELPPGQAHVMRRSRIRDPTWQSIASVVDPLFRLAMLFTPAWPISRRLTSLAAAWIACIKQFRLHRKMRASEVNAAMEKVANRAARNPLVIRASAPQARAADVRALTVRRRSDIRLDGNVHHGTAPGWP